MATDVMAALERVLHVEDDESIIAIARVALENVGGLTVCSCSSGREALAKAASFDPELVLLDVMMPGMDGPEVCAELKKLALSIPIILLTAKDDMATRGAGMDLGVSEFVVKPVNNKDLLARIKTQISTREWEREIDQTSATIKTS